MRQDKYADIESNVKSSENTKTEQIINNKREQEWLEENKEAIEKQNERMEKEGSFSDEHRRF